MQLFLPPWLGRDFLCTLDGTHWRLRSSDERGCTVTVEVEEWGVVHLRMYCRFSGSLLAGGWYHRDYLGLFETVEGIEMNRSVLSKAAKAVTQTLHEVALVDEKFEAKYPNLAAFMLLNFDDDGKPRKLSKVSIFADAGSWKASLQDAQNQYSLFVTLSDPSMALAALEKALAGERVDWRAWPNSANGNGKARPKTS